MKRKLRYVRVKKSPEDTEVTVLEKSDDDFDYRHMKTDSSERGSLAEEILEARELLNAVGELSGELEATQEEQEQRPILKNR